MRQIGFLILALALLGGWTTMSAQDGPKIDPEFAAWYYPGATYIGSSTSSGTLHQALLTTEDSLAKIEKFYMKKSDSPLADKLDRDSPPPPFGIHTSLSYPHPKDDKKQILAIWGDDSKMKTDGEDRGVTIRTMVYDTAEQLVTITASRTPKEKTTHVVLLYLKKN